MSMTTLQVKNASGVTKDLLVSADSAGTLVPHHNLEGIDPSFLSAFGTLETGELTPVFQTDFIHGINSQTGVTAVSGAGASVTTEGGRLQLNSGTAATTSAVYRSRRPVKYRAGQGMMARFTPVFNPLADNSQLVGVGNEDDGYLVGYEDEVFGIRHRNSAGSDTWIPQSSFNGDTLDGDGPSGMGFTISTGTPFMIKWPFLGYGNIMFFIQNQETGRWILFHMIKYAGTTDTLQLGNPNLFFWAENTNIGNTTDTPLYVGSVGVFLSGMRSFVSCPKWAADNSKTGITTTETTLFSVRNATSYNGSTNRSLVRLQSLSVGAVSSSQDRRVTVRLRTGATIGGSPVYNPINGTSSQTGGVNDGITITSGNSIASVDTAGTTAANGNLVYNIGLVATANMVIDLTPFDLFIAPGETLTVSAVANNTTDVVAALNWAEDI